MIVDEQQALREGLETEALGFLTDLLGRKAATTLVDFAANDAQLRYRSFTPVGSMLIGLRFRGGAGTDKKLEQRQGRQLKIIEGRVEAVPRSNMMFTPPLVPHRTEHNYGFWHVNDEQELGINISLGEEKRVTVLIEGFPEKGRHDRFAWYCSRCVTPLFVRACETHRVGLGGFYQVQQEAVREFNADEALRTCNNCGDVHPLAYSAFDWADTPEQRAARAIW
jgi:hypothetical protein